MSGDDEEGDIVKVEKSGLGVGVSMAVFYRANQK